MAVEARVPRGFAPTDERLIVGMMSGSSVDGIDAALVRVTGCCETTTFELVNFVSMPFNLEVRRSIFQLFEYETSTVDKVTLMNAVLGELFAEAAIAVVCGSGMTMSAIDAIGLWPQMVYHLPTRSNPQDILGYHIGACLQLGDLNVIAERTGVTTVGCFSSRDIAAGGNGAPLYGVATYVFHHHQQRNRAIQNIGGIANVAFVLAEGGIDDIVGFDTGPGNMLIDSVVLHSTAGEHQYDPDGRMAASGRPNAAVLEMFLADPFIQQKPPKAAGRENFGEQFTRRFLEACAASDIPAIDMVATATALTVEAIALNYERYLMPRAAVDEVIVGGGGALNPTLVQMLRERLAPIPVSVDDDHGISSFAKEAIFTALGTNEPLYGHANNIPSVTGADRHVVMGLIAPGFRGAPV